MEKYLNETENYHKDTKTTRRDKETIESQNNHSKMQN